jgi:predicted dehydrogenase
MTAADQVLVSGILSGGAPISMYYRGGAARDGDGLFWEINGTKGDIRITGFSGHIQMVQLSVKGIQDGEKAFRSLDIPNSYRSGWPTRPEPANVARVYAMMAQDLINGTHTAPTFDDAIAVHRIIEAIEEAAVSGKRVVV